MINLKGVEWKVHGLF